MRLLRLHNNDECPPPVQHMKLNSIVMLIYSEVKKKNILQMFNTLWAVAFCPQDQHHGRRIYSEEKGNVVTAAGGTGLLTFLAELAFLHQDDLKNRMIYTGKNWRIGWFYLLKKSYLKKRKLKRKAYSKITGVREILKIV